MTPRSTYRVQVRPDFDLDATARITAYLARLGVTHLYSAPLLAATPGSEHGYDVVDPTRTSPELGGPDALDLLVSTLKRRRLGLIVDLVPNHQGVRVPQANPAWWSVLRDGPDSAYASWFDIDWDRGPLVIPVLGSDAELDDLVIDGDELRYFEHRFPIAAGTNAAGRSARDVHDRQHYRLVDWRRANAELNYRRFFAINDLAGVRVENPDVFDATHREVRRWIDAGMVDGVRVDHPDGLRDPGTYLRRLRDLIGDRWLVVEKILEYGEALPPGWPVDGTTGYDALRYVCGLFVDGAGAEAFASSEPLRNVILAGKRSAATTLFQTEITRLLRLAPSLADLPDIRPALAEVAAQMPVYRTYLLESEHSSGDDGVGHLRSALAAAYPRFPDAIAALGTVLFDPHDDVAIRFQQLTGAVMAKGVEDTAYYRWNRFIALNEVGGAPDHFGVSVEEFHAAASDRQRYWPASMTTLSTHDTKRGEDVRARLAVLSEIGPAWQQAYVDWSVRHPLDDAEFTSLLWQTVVGVWPIERSRLHAYAEKAAREAATSTSWDAPNLAFEQALHRVIDAMYDDEALRSSIDSFVARITPAGWSNALGQKIVQLTMPGVPDTYQGTELWDNSLVDPDNRRPVDFAERAHLLGTIDGGPVNGSSVNGSSDDGSSDDGSSDDGGAIPPIDPSGAAKLLVTSRALRLRRDRPDLFTTYRPRHATGPRAAHAVAFDRGGAITVATRLPVGLAAAGGWTDTDALPLPAGAWRDELTGGTFTGTAPLRSLLAAYPVALLVRPDRSTGRIDEPGLDHD